ncbi:MAG: hypothetical protein ACRD5J_14075 [Nitrososphaeraceae archaeon]
MLLGGINSHIAFLPRYPVTVLFLNYLKILALDYFEIDRLIEDLAKMYSCSCASSWFRIESQWNPTRDEFRNKVVEFMNHFEYTLSTFPNSPESEKFKKRARELLQKESMLVLQGDNKEVEKRYNYFVNSR